MTSKIYTNYNNKIDADASRIFKMKLMFLKKKLNNDLLSPTERVESNDKIVDIIKNNELPDKEVSKIFFDVFREFHSSH